MCASRSLSLSLSLSLLRGVCACMCACAYVCWCVCDIVSLSLLLKVRSACVCLYVKERTRELSFDLIEEERKEKNESYCRYSVTKITRNVGQGEKKRFECVGNNKQCSLQLFLRH